MNQKEIEKLLNDCCGTDEKGKGKVVATISIEEWNDADENTSSTLLGKFTASTPALSVTFMNEMYAMVDLDFFTNSSYEFRSFWQLYQKPLPQNEEGKIYIKRITIVPIDFNGFYMECVAPVFASLHASDIKSPCNAIRSLFHNDSVGFYFTNEINVDDVDQDIIDEEQTKEFLKQKEEERSQMRADYGTPQVVDSPDAKETPNTIRIFDK